MMDGGQKKVTDEVKFGHLVKLYHTADWKTISLTMK